MSALDTFLKKYNNVPESSESPTGSRVMTFGRHKNKTWDWIYDNDKSYIAFAMKGDTRYWKKPQEYWRSRIEEDYGEQKD